MWRFGILLALASCGRLGFAELPAEVNPDASGSSSVGSDAALPMATLLACGSAQRFAFDTDQSGIGVAARETGIDVIDVDSAGAVWGYSYTLGTTGQLAAVATHVSLGTGGTGDGVGGASLGDQSVVVADSSSSSTLVMALNATLASTNPPSSDKTSASGTTPIASNGSALMLAELDNNDAIVRSIGIDGSESANTTLAGSASLGPYFLNAMATKTGFALGYGTTTPVGGGLALFDDNLKLVMQVALGPASGPEFFSPWFAYSPGQDAFIVAWHQKDGGPDDAWAMIVDGSTLATRVPAFEVSPNAANVVAAADDDGFWLAYQQDNLVAASHVDIAGNVVARPVASSGGKADNWNMIERDGQAILVWTEAGGTGPNLYLDPFCN